MTALSNNILSQQLQAKFGAGITHITESFGMLTVTVEKNLNIQVIDFLVENPEWEFTFLSDLCGIHYPDHKGQELGVVYHLHSLRNNHRIRIRVFTDAADPEVPSLTLLFRSANWMERETYDFYGIRFTGHPNLKRILNMDEMTYFPLQKQYPLEDGSREDKDDTFFGR